MEQRPDGVARMQRASAEPGDGDERPLVAFDHHSAGHVRDPWATYARLRAECPVAYTEAWGGFWVLSRYRDVERASLDPGTFSSDRDDLLMPARSSGRLLPVQADPPAATAYRRVLQPFFSVAAVRALEPAIRRFVTDRIDDFVEQGVCDLVLDLANPVPAMTTLHLVGFPSEDWAAFADPIHAYTYRRIDDPEGQVAARRVAELRGRIEEAVRDRRARPRGPADMISHLVGAAIDGRPLDDEEIVSLVLMVVFGGIDTTTAAIGNALLYLHRHHDDRRRVAAEPARLALAIEELLRYEPPVQGFVRTVTRSCPMDGWTIPRDDAVMLLWASANRDEDAFEEAAAVRLDRSPNRHLTFGVGVHRCLGATIARAELRIVLSEVLRRFPDYVVDEQRLAVPQTVGIVYGRERMPASFTPGPRQGSA